jgi:hypothetical protein
MHWLILKTFLHMGWRNNSFTTSIYTGKTYDTLKDELNKICINSLSDRWTYELSVLIYENDKWHYIDGINYTENPDRLYEDMIENLDVFDEGNIYNIE